MNSIYFTEEHQSFRESLKILQKEVVPHIEKWEKPALLTLLWKKFGEMGYFGIAYPEAWWIKLRLVLRYFS
jgi:alkylation response protein AidB-like acyl-CoA dehydrogenase